MRRFMSTSLLSSSVLARAVVLAVTLTGSSRAAAQGADTVPAPAPAPETTPTPSPSEPAPSETPPPETPPEPPADPAPAPLAPVAPAPPPEPSEPAPSLTVLPAVPSPFRPGAFLLSFDDALSIVSIGRAQPFPGSNALAFGSTPSFDALGFPKLPSLDYVFGHRITAGGAVALGFAERVRGDDALLSDTFLTVRARGGVVLPLTDRLALWPRIGAAVHSDLDEHHQLDVEAEARLAWTLAPSLALTLGAGVAVPVHTFRPDTASSFPFTVPTPSPPLPSATVRIPVTVGFTTALDGPATSAEPDAPEEHGDPRAPLASGTLIVGLDALLEPFAYESRVVRPDAGPAGSGIERLSVADTRSGITDAWPSLPRAPRLSADVVLARYLTLGLGAGVGWSKVTDSSDVVPQGGAPTVFGFTLAPRVGALLPLASRLSLWPRAGISYAYSRHDRGLLPDETMTHLGYGADVFLAVRLTPHFLLAAGPSVTGTLDGRLEAEAARGADLEYFHAGVSGMAALTF